MSEGSETKHVYTPNGTSGFVMLIAEECVPTVDGREFAAGSIEWREPPLSLMFIRSNDPTGRGGHKSSASAGTITEIWREDNEFGAGKIFGKGFFATDEFGDEARTAIAEGVISGVSADVGGAVVEELEASDDGGHRRIIRSGTIVAVTALPIPAFADTKISVVHDDETIIASANGSWAPQSSWFDNPNLAEPTPITITADGQVFGHAALWGTCHVGYRDRCVTPPHSKHNYTFFNTGNVLTADGKTVHVGRLTAGTGHASIEFGAGPAVQHYDDTGWQGALVHAGEDQHGVYVAGVVSPTATAAQIATLRASAISGDWRAIQGGLELVGVLAVNTPGFPVPRARAGLVAGAQVSLIASGLCGCENEELAAEETIIENLQAVVETVEADEPVGPDFELALALLDLEMWEVTGIDFGKYKKGKKEDCGCEGCPDCADLEMEEGIEFASGPKKPRPMYTRYKDNRGKQVRR